MQNKNLIAYIKEQFRTGGMIKKLILVNAAVFLFYLILQVSSKLFLINSDITDGIYYALFVLPGSFSELLYKPWTLITNLFGHGDFSHFAFNMLVFFFTAKIFVSLLGEKRLLSTYILGGVFGALIHMVSHLIFPVFNNVDAAPIIGASGSISALIGALVFHRPDLKVKLFFAIEIPFWVLGLLFIIKDVLALTADDGIAHFAHLGGAVFGVLSVLNVSKSTNFMNRFEAMFSGGISFKRNPKMKVYRNSEAPKMSDDYYNANKANKKKQMDAILDKISANGYDSLSKKDKDFLFKYSNE